jgi:hypothetical protein
MKLSLCATASFAVFLASALTAAASNHREAPITALDHAADITDLYAFVSYDAAATTPSAPTHVTLILCVDPLLEPANGPTLFPFDPSISYEIRVDNDHDGLEDKIVRYRFTTQYQLPAVYTSVAGFGPNGANAPGTGTLVVPPQITSLSDVGLNQRQTYTCEMVDVHTGLITALTQPNGAPFVACPANAGPRTMNYYLLFNEATYALASGVSVFAGTTDDAFWIDLGAAFDTANFRTLGSGVPGVLTAAEDAANQNLASDSVSGYAVNTLAIELPIEMLTSSGAIEPPTSPAAVLGVWGVTSRPMTTVRVAPNAPIESGPFVQIQRVGNPLINELVIGIGMKDRFSMDEPSNDSQFASFFLDPPIVRIVEALYGGALAVPAAPRTDLLPLVTYAAPIAPAGTPAGPIADLLRLNTGVAATPVASASRLGLIGGDAAGFPNGRRVFDDVTDITLRVAVGGVLAAPFPGFDPNVNGRLGDGVNQNDQRYQRRFPYVGTCPGGRDRRHVDPGEIGGGPVN